MSHDVYLEADLGGPELVGIDHPTLNIFGPGLGLISRALGEPLGPAIDARPVARDLDALLRVALERLDTGVVMPGPEEDGVHWAHAVRLLATLAEWCERAPLARVRCCR
jgi:hypothetical protein